MYRQSWCIIRLRLNLRKVEAEETSEQSWCIIRLRLNLRKDSSGGLDFLDAFGGWVEATPQPASVVCNLGEVVQLITGGLYPATVHRVRRPTVAGRLSAPFFWNPSLDVEVQPFALAGKVPSLTGRPEEAENRMLQSYGMNAFKSLARSHPRVLARHHPDLRVLPDGQVVYR
ncbi:Gibberellin 3-beta-dioxygenase 2 [Symbiodinium microadriaticum]|uniref:Gibberellin 3-beta-dioxygenase 2 n=1 Tax=Symbiodinium microadriaticum TaxID=2951 RepID=A0A1Q9CMG5_SYMMI|nr:Gibberellin 3-beta-dioxygenase 2 [Symbiodinium microadriaticum]